MSRVEENEILVALLKETNIQIEDSIDILLADISTSLAVIADSLRKQEVKMPYIHVDPELTKEFEKSCSNCKFWRLDANDKNRRCKYCYNQDEWQAESEVEEW